LYSWLGKAGRWKKVVLSRGVSKYAQTVSRSIRFALEIIEGSITRRVQKKILKEDIVAVLIVRDKGPKIWMYFRTWHGHG